MKKIGKLLVFVCAAAISFSATADTCRDVYNRVKFYSAVIWQGDDINPPYVRCYYNDDVPRRPDPHLYYTLPGKFAPVSGRWLTYYGQSTCFYKQGPCVYTKVG